MIMPTLIFHFDSRRTHHWCLIDLGFELGRQPITGDDELRHGRDYTRFVDWLRARDDWLICALFAISLIVATWLRVDSLIDYLSRQWSFPPIYWLMTGHRLTDIADYFLLEKPHCLKIN